MPQVFYTQQGVVWNRTRNSANGADTEGVDFIWNTGGKSA